jgi:hypothetical protein
MLMKVSWLIRANHALERHCKWSGDRFDRQSGKYFDDYISFFEF